MNTFSKFTPFLKTIEDRNQLVAELQLVQQALFSTDQQKIEDIYSSQIRHEVSEALQELFQTGDRQAVFSAFEAYLHQLEVVQIVLAFEPSQDQLELLADSIQSSEGNPRLIDLKVDPTIVGGMRVAVGGKYGDYSLRTKITAYWQDHQQEILAKVLTREPSGA